jgi:hypothetical protein
MADFTTYWLPQQVRDNQGALLDHAADNNFRDVAPGDTVWVVTVRQGELFLVGRIPVARVLDQADAEELLGGPLWEADFHIYCPKKRAEPAGLVPVGKETWKLSFVSDTSPSLNPKAGKLDAQQVRRVRRLTPASAAILSRVWASREAVGVDSMPPRERDGLPDVDDGVVVSGREGKKRWYRHLRRERDRSLAARKKRKVKADTGSLRCESCHFDFEQVFGPSLEGFCEVHHRNPLSSDDTERETRLDDLAVLCANCHRAIHRLGPEMPTVGELAAMIRRSKRQRSQS